MIPEKFRKSNGYVIYVYQSPSNKVLKEVNNDN